MLKTRALLSAVIFSTLGFSAVAQEVEPLSAISWLSKNAATRPDVAMIRPVARGARGDQAALAMDALPFPVKVEPLTKSDLNKLGLMTPARAGLSETLWGQSRARDLAQGFRRDFSRMPAPLRDLARDLAASSLPLDNADSPRDMLFFARVDSLIQMGDLDTAQALLARAGLDRADVFRRWFDIALLRGGERGGCERMRTLPRVTPKPELRIFCLINANERTAARKTLDNAKHAGALTPRIEALLVAYLDDVDHDMNQWRPAVPSPLVYALFRAIGQPYDTGRLPIAFAHAKLTPNSGWKAQIEAAERLARHGAISPEILFSKYRAKRPAASGGVWERAKAIQRLDQALARGGENIDRHLYSAWRQMQQAGLAVPFATQFAPKLTDISLSPAAQRVAAQIGYLSQKPELGLHHFRLRFISDLVEDRPSVPRSTTEEAIFDAFTAQEPPDRLFHYFQQKRNGEALFFAFSLIADGGIGNYDDYRDGLLTLRLLGLEQVARHTAIHMLLIDQDL